MLTLRRRGCSGVWPAGLQVCRLYLRRTHGVSRRGLRSSGKRLGLQDRVEFCGARTDVASILSRAQVMLLITNWEGFPITILEAMRAGLPVIVSDVGGTGESVTHEDTGLLVPPRDVTALRAALTKLLESPELRVRMGSAGRARYEKEFALSTMLRRTLGVYEAALRTEMNRNPGLESHAVTLANLMRTWGIQEHAADAI